MEVYAADPWSPARNSQLLGAHTLSEGRLTIERLLTSGHWPKFKAKAAATRHLARYALLVDLDRRTTLVAQLLVRFHTLIDHEDTPKVSSAHPRGHSPVQVVFQFFFHP